MTDRNSEGVSIEMLPLPKPVAYADPVSFRNFKERGHLGGPHGREWMWAKPDAGLVAMYSAEQVAARDAEIEALREEVDRWKSSYNAAIELKGRAFAESDRLAEALRDARSYIDVTVYPLIISAIDAALRDHDQKVKDG